jgi:hypothetical protein
MASASGFLVVSVFLMFSVLCCVVLCCVVLCVIGFALFLRPVFYKPNFAIVSGFFNFDYPSVLS